MKLPSLMLFLVFAAVAVAVVQAQPASEGYFPASGEFPELQKAASEEAFDDPERLSGIEGARLFLDVGFDHYARRIYTAGDSRSVSIEVVTLRDYRASYSLLTLLRNSDIKAGHPGDAFTSDVNGIRFAQGREYVRIQGSGVSEDLLARVAASISNHIGTERRKPPSLVSHFPKLGYDASSLRYFPGLKTYEGYHSAGEYLKLNADAEVAQAHYFLESRTGILSLLNFPTTEIAEDYFENPPGLKSVEKNGSIFMKRAGPIVAVLDGTFDPASAERILNSIKYSYSISWVYEKRKPAIVWGLPTSILGTVINSAFFVVLVGLVSIIAGAGLAVLRFWLHERALAKSQDQPDQTGIIHLRMR